MHTHTHTHVIVCMCTNRRMFSGEARGRRRKKVRSFCCSFRFHHFTSNFALRVVSLTFVFVSFSFDLMRVLREYYSAKNVTTKQKPKYFNCVTWNGATTHELCLANKDGKTPLCLYRSRFRSLVARLLSHIPYWS